MSSPLLYFSCPIYTFQPIKCSARTLPQGFPRLFKSHERAIYAVSPKLSYLFLFLYILSHFILFLRNWADLKFCRISKRINYKRTNFVFGQPKQENSPRPPGAPLCEGLILASLLEGGGAKRRRECFFVGAATCRPCFSVNHLAARPSSLPY